LIACSWRPAAERAAEAELEARLVKEIRFDPDLWIIEVEDRAGRNFLNNVMHDLDLGRAYGGP
jgi:hypothetical protein